MTMSATMTTRPAGGLRAMNVGLWVAQILLALSFGLFGSMKALQPLDQVAHLMKWVPTVPPALVRGIGIAEMFGAIGILLPAATRILPRLTVAAAACFIAVQVLAIAFHASRGETAHTVWLNIIMISLAIFVFWGRTRRVVIQPRG